MSEFNQTHFEPFLTMARPGCWVGHDLAKFSARFSSAIPHTAFSGVGITRENLKKAAGLPESEVSSRWLTRAVLAWGGLRYGAIQNVNAQEDEIVALVATTRQRGFSRKVAYVFHPGTLH